jgi:succinate dehydrogenase/fumarate reductase flavoprotein subunit
VERRDIMIDTYNDINNQGNVIFTDVLVVGGGCGGLVTALKAKEESNIDVLIVDKANVGFAGQASRAGNGILGFNNNTDLEKYMEYYVRNIGGYLNDQNMLCQMTEINREALKQLLAWGVKITTDKNGELGYFDHPVGQWQYLGIELNMTDTLKNLAVKSGVKIKNNIQITTLLKDGDAVSGAVGFNILDGSFYIFKAKTVVLSTAGCGYRNIRMFTGRGEGIKLAWDAEAQMRNAEFGNFFEVVSALMGKSIYGTQDFIYNQNGENIWDKYVTWDAPDVCPELILGMEKEIREGRGPLYVDMEKVGDAWKNMGAGIDDVDGLTRMFPDKLKWMKRLSEREHMYFDLGIKPEVKVGLHGNTGCIRVDLNMSTTVKGLYAVGSDTWNGSAVGGAVPNPGLQRGNGLMNAVVTGMFGGPAAAKYAASTNQGNISLSDVEKAKADTYAFLNRESGGNIHDAITNLQNIVCKVKYNLRRSEKNLLEGIEKLEELKTFLDSVKASNFHNLMLCHEADAMILTAEIMLKSALERKESRGFHFREDYPETDNKNWLKWVVADNNNGNIVISTEDIPINDYKIQP